MNGIESGNNPAGASSVGDTLQDNDRGSTVSPLRFLVRDLRSKFEMENLRAVRKSIVDSDLFSVWMFLLAMPILGLVIQNGLFLIGKTCSPFPMWFSFLVFSALALLIRWKCLLQFWGLLFLALFLSAFTFSYMDYDAEVYHLPMQILLREGWNPVFDSSLPKFTAIADPSSLQAYHTLFLPKTIALCGALIAESTGLWIADSFIGYVLIFVLFRTSFVFARKQWDCSRTSGLLFAFAIALNTKLMLAMEGRIDFHTYSAQMIMLLSLVLYLRDHRLHDFILAVLATVICSTSKTIGLVNCVFIWGLFGIYSWKRKETYLGVLAVSLLIAWIGMSPLITAWIQYGSPFYPSMTFDPKIATVDITSDFQANADGERMGYLARFVYAWISPFLAKKACALYYHKEDFNPVFYVLGGVGGLKSLNLLFCGSILLLMLAKKDLVTVFCLFIVFSLVLCPVKYIGYARYFPQAWAVIPLGFYQFAYDPPAWLRRKNILAKLSCYSLLSLLALLCAFSAATIFAFQTRCLIREGIRQKLLASFHENDVEVALPRNSKRAYTLSRRLQCADVDFRFTQQDMDMDHFEEDTSFPHFKHYYMEFWRSDRDYPVCSSLPGFVRFRWLDLFRYFPHPLFHQVIHKTDSPVPGKDTFENQEQTL